MPQTLDPKTKEILRKYLRETRSLTNEAARRQRFSALIAELFPGTRAVTDFARGVEKLIRIKTEAGEKRGHADAYYGNAIIEFEKSLDATLHEAEEQLREYVAGSWPKKQENAASMLAIASDGVEWRIYRPILLSGAPPDPLPGHFRLDLLRDFKLSEEKLGDFWLWLTGILFRPQQVEPTPQQFQLDFGSWSPLYRQAMVALKKAWAKASEEPEASVAFETWQKYLTVTYGKLTESPTRTTEIESGVEISELEDLFLRHTYLSSIARLLIWAALSQGKTGGSLREVAKTVLSGDFFKSKRLANLVDDDFFHWVRRPQAEETLASAWERILSHLLEYDLARLNQDVLKGVYQQLIDPKDRHDLGEYYTPDWLCERIVAELFPKEGYKTVLDPSCGSGSFLRAAIAHFIEHNPSGSDADHLRSILSSVNGIDIHPVAVTISRATYVLALGSLVKAARKPIQIPVYLADSLFLPREVEEDLFDKLKGIEIAYGQRKDERRVIMPQTLIHSPDLFDGAIAACTSVAEDHARTQHESKAALERHLAQAVPDLQQMLEYKGILDALWEFTEGLADLIRQHKNSIWSFIIRNSYRPAMFRQRFDIIIGNPPWLSYRYIADPEYQKEIKKRAVEQYKIAPKSQKLFTQMELATVFLAHSMAVFARPGAELGFVMTRSILSADQHQKLITREYNSPFSIKGYWDLWDVTPLFNVPACVLFAQQDANHGKSTDSIPAEVWHGNLPDRNVAWSVAKPKLESVAETAKVIYLGQRCAFSTEPGESSPSKPSKYQKSFKQGATIVPRSFYFVRIADLNGAADPATSYWAETDPEQARQAKAPYQDVHLSGLVEGRFIFSSALAKHLLPFVVLPPATVVLPIEEHQAVLHVRTAAALNATGYREFAKWMRQAEGIWKEKREDKSGRQTLLQWLDYQGKLTAQNLAQRHLVLYNAAGTNVSAAHFDRRMYSLPLLVEHKLYWIAVRNADEAHYLAAVLNSEAANQAIKPFQSTGLLGERDIEKKLLDYPIPLYSAAFKDHRKLAELGEKARLDAAAIVKSPSFPAGTSLARQRAAVRVALKDTLAEIDLLVRKLLA
ncbi:MAG: N-6 DNA methylase [Candidatus Acidiferrales bacterium]